MSRVIDELFPGWVECSFIDAHGIQHLFHEKKPIVSNENLFSTSQYPRSAAIRCETLAQWQDAAGRSLVQVTTERPDGIETTSVQSRFVCDACICGTSVQGAQMPIRVSQGALPGIGEEHRSN